MKFEKFEQFLHQVVPSPNSQTTGAWYRYGLEMCDEFSYAFLERLAISFGFLGNNFSPETVQGVYSVISHGTLLPSEMVAAAVYVQNGGTAPQVAAQANQGHLMCFHTPQSADENSPLALLSVQEKGNLKSFYTVDFGSFQPEKVLRQAKAHAKEYAIPVINSVALVWNDKSSCPTKTNDSSHRLFMGGDQDMVQALSAIFKTCPAVAARITFTAEENEVRIDYNPLWRELAERRKAEALLGDEAPSHRKASPRRPKPPKGRDR